MVLAFKHFCLLLFLITTTYSCIRIAPTSHPEAPNIAEASEQAEIFYDIWDDDFIKKFKDLPEYGEARKKPFTGHWYPHHYGGTARVFPGKSYSALQKYDQAFPASDGTAVGWERRFHSSVGSKWTGHCNGFAAASQRHLEPRVAVKRNGVIFTPADIKTLLTEIHQHVHTYMLGGRRCRNVLVEKISAGGGASCPAGYRKIMLSNGKTKCIRNAPTRAPSPHLSNCEDVNAGTFHLALANWVGRREQTIVFDKEAYHQVWNYPLFSYHLGQESRFISKAEALRLTGQRGHRYPFNSAATSFYYAKMHIGYAQVLQNSESDRPIFKKSSEVYTYILEIDDFGDIVGGEWIGDSYHTHPDFLWIALEPQKSMTESEARRVMSGSTLQRYLQGMSSRANPYLDIATVMDLWAESVELAPGSMPPSLSLPDRSTAWGQDPRFSVLLDGGTNGSAFLGKEVSLAITLTDEQDSDGTQVSLNNGTITPDTRSNAELHFMITPRPGINTLRISLANDPIEKKIIFHAVL